MLKHIQRQDEMDDDAELYGVYINPKVLTTHHDVQCGFEVPADSVLFVLISRIS